MRHSPIEPTLCRGINNIKVGYPETPTWPDVPTGVYHYVGGLKPWHRLARHINPYHNLWWRELDSAGLSRQPGRGFGRPRAYQNALKFRFARRGSTLSLQVADRQAYT